MMTHETTNTLEDASAALDAQNLAKRRKLFPLLLLVILLIAGLFAAWYVLTQQGRVRTDNAYVGADSAQITALVAGPIQAVPVVDTQEVRKGEILVVLDDAEYQVAVAEARAALAQARQHYRQAEASTSAAQARVTARAAEILQAKAQLRDSKAAVERTRAELARRESIAGTGAVSAEDLTAARTAYQSALAARDLAEAAINSAQAVRGSADGDFGAAEVLTLGLTIDTSPNVAMAKARLDRAELDLSRTVIRAPFDGVVTNKQVQVGERVAAGAPLMIVVPVACVYVDANFKESQFEHLRIGQPAELTSDYHGSGVTYRGTVVGFNGGTGAAFALIPAQNATGNWIKVVQRLPVRIALEPDDLKAYPLRVGLSMDVTVDTRGE